MSALPVPLLSLGGTWLCAFRLALNFMVSAMAPEAAPRSAASANPMTPLRMIVVFIAYPPFEWFGYRAALFRKHRAAARWRDSSGIARPDRRCRLAQYSRLASPCNSA